MKRIFCCVRFSLFYFSVSLVVMLLYILPREVILARLRDLTIAIALKHPGRPLATESSSLQRYPTGWGVSTIIWIITSRQPPSFQLHEGKTRDE